MYNRMIRMICLVRADLVEAKSTSGFPKLDKSVTPITKCYYTTTGTGTFYVELSPSESEIINFWFRNNITTHGDPKTVLKSPLGNLYRDLCTINQELIDQHTKSRPIHPLMLITFRWITGTIAVGGIGLDLVKGIEFDLRAPYDPNDTKDSHTFCKFDDKTSGLLTVFKVSTGMSIYLKDRHAPPVPVYSFTETYDPGCSSR
jgi:hypothetical protein